MITRFVPVQYNGKYIDAKKFCFIATGDLSNATKQNTEKYIRKLNRKSGKELLKVEYSGQNSILMTEDARKQMKMIVFVPDETVVTLKEIESVYARADEIAALADDADAWAFEYAERLKLADGKDNFKYYRTDFDSEAFDKFTFSEIHPVPEDKFAQMMVKLRDDDSDDLIDDAFEKLNIQNEYDITRFAVLYGIYLYVMARDLLSKHLNIEMLVRDGNIEKFLQLRNHLNDIPDSAFEEKDGMMDLIYGSSLNTPERIRECTIEAYMGAWLGEYVHTMNPDWEWMDANLDTPRNSLRLVLKNIHTGARIDPMGLIHSFLRDGNDAKIQELIAGIRHSAYSPMVEEAVVMTEVCDSTDEFDENENLPELIFNDDEPDVRLLSIDCPNSLSEEKQSEICRIIDVLNAEIGFEAMGYILASHLEANWAAEQEQSIALGEMILDSSNVDDEDIDDIKATLNALRAETFDLSKHSYTFVLLTDQIYRFDQLKAACKILQQVYDCVRSEFDEDKIDITPGQRIALDDGHTWVKVTIEDDEVIWRDEYCPYDGEYARMLQQVCYDDYTCAAELDQIMMQQPASIWGDDPERYMPTIARTRALSFIDLMRDFFDKEIDISVDSLESVALFMNAVRNSLTADCNHLLKDASPRIVRMFKTLLKHEDDEGVFEMMNIDSVLYQDIIRPLSGWLGELMRMNCANLVWKMKVDDGEDGSKTMETVLEETEQQITYYPSAHAEKFFYRRQRELGIEEYYYSLIEQMHFKPAVKHEYRFKHLPEDNLPNNILPFRMK